MIDAYLWGKVDRISPEAPVPIVSVIKKESRLGGASNVALNIKALGATPIICSIAGDDTEGKELINLLKAEAIEHKGVLIIPRRQTTVKTRILGHNQQILRVDAETDQEINSEQTKEVFTKALSFINDQKIDAIIFEDYDKGLITQELIDNVIHTAKQKQIPVIVDPKKRNFLSYNHVDLFKPNLKELKEGIKMEFNEKNISELREAVTLLRDQINAKNIMVTLSELGVYVLNDKKNILTPAHIRNVADVSGAGDTVISVVATCMAAGADTFTAAAIGNIAGGLVCEKVGVVPIDKELLLRESLKL